ncbi:MAG TPA: hypothetical protein VFT82_01475, partial [Candidatus Paceibacterota bacterium]|nr:hypothetical protein [Candidatus Paceibacterota bacterium]
SDSFTNKSKEHDQEWTNPGNVKPVGKTRFPSAIDAMIENGVQVFFTDKETFARIQKSSDYGYSILKTLESENMKRGENVREIVA